VPNHMWVALAVFAVGGVLIAAVLAVDAVSPDAGVVALASVAMVSVTIVYVGITADIARANAETLTVTTRLADETATLARETTKMAEASVKQAEATAGTLLHMQRPVLVVSVVHPPANGSMKVRVHNVGEGAAYEPHISLHGGPSGQNLLPASRYLLPPRQFEESGSMVNQSQAIDVPEPSGNECRLMARCLDPRTGEVVHREWRIHTDDRSTWLAHPVVEPEE